MVLEVDDHRQSFEMVLYDCWRVARVEAIGASSDARECAYEERST